MFRHLLVPLDGSGLAEAAAPAAAYLAQALGASVTLIHIIEADAPAEVHGERHLAEPGEALAYLDAIKTRAFPPAATVECHVHTREARDVARSIVEHVDELAPDLIIMCTHGRGGVRDLLFGNIAQQVIGLGETPVLLIPPTRADGAPSFHLERVLVALDGNADHEAGLVAAASLARACSAALALLMVVHTPDTLPWQGGATARLLPGTSAALLDLTQDGAVKYLRKHVAQLQASGLTATAEVQRGDPAESIVQSARRLQVDLITLGTHGRSQMGAFWSGSVTPRVAGRSHLPLLLVPVAESTPER